MGAEATCVIRIDGRSETGTARLEQKELRFRGPFRLTLPLSSIAAARAEAGILHLRIDGRDAELDLGEPAASRWAQRITSPPSRLAKLGVKPGARVALVHLTDPVFKRELEGGGASIVARAADAQIVFLGVVATKDLDQLTTLAGQIDPASAIWIVRRKGGAGVSERDSMAAGARAGLVDVKVVSYSDTQTAEKYVIPVARRARSPRRPARAPRAPGSAAPPGRT
jgi:hypothetical protein